jgi:serine/threonine-protein kinase
VEHLHLVTAPAHDRLRAALDDRYRVERELGSGGMATVYLARDLKHERHVAIKVLKPELAAVLGAERFVVEIKTTASLQHPHILPLFDSGTVEGFLYYVMPYIQGETVRDRLNRETQLGVDDAVRIAREVADALDYAHRHGVIHRDIKPENILLHDGRAMVMDFGIALAVSAAAGGRMTETGLSLGTPHYMSPEQATADKDLTARSDIYSLGSVLYEMLAGEPPHVGGSAQAVIMKIITDVARPVNQLRRSVPAHVAAAVAKAVEKLPADRFTTAAQFAEALVRPDLMTATAAAPSAGAAHLPTSGLRRFVSATAAVWSLLALSIVVGAWGWAKGARVPPPPVFKATLAPNAGIDLSLAPQLTISRDGSRIAFLGQDSTLQRQIYIRAFDRVEAVPVAGTRGATNPFFSPDGASIGFAQGGKLKTVALASGSVTTVCDWQIAPSGGTWGDDGTIVISSSYALYRVSATGGEPQLLVSPRGVRGAALSPHFLRGARGLLFAVQGDSAGIYALRIGDSTATRVAPRASHPQYVEPGLVLTGTTDGIVSVTPFDAERLTVTGRAEPLTDGVLVAGETISKFAVARNGTVAYLYGGVSIGRDLVVVDRAGVARDVPIGRRLYRYPRFSPDGRHLAMHVEVRGGMAGDLWRYAFDGDRLIRLTSDSSSAQPEWSPDGRSLIFVRRTRVDSTNVLALFRMPSDGSGSASQLLVRPQNIYESRLTPDGRTLVFREDLSGTNRDILTAPVDSPSAVRPLVATLFDEKGIAMSPDGKWLAYVSNETGENEVYIRRLQDVSARWPVSVNGGTEPRWAKSGEIFFRRGDSVFVAPVELGAEPRVTTPRAIFRGIYASNTFEPLWDVSPDGSRFVFVRNIGSGSSPIGLLMNWTDHWRARTR